MLSGGRFTLVLDMPHIYFTLPLFTTQIIFCATTHSSNISPLIYFMLVYNSFLLLTSSSLFPHISHSKKRPTLIPAVITSITRTHYLVSEHCVGCFYMMGTKGKGAQSYILAATLIIQNTRATISLDPRFLHFRGQVIFTS